MLGVGFTFGAGAEGSAAATNVESFVALSEKPQEGRLPL